MTALSPLSVSGHSVDPGLAGLLGRRAPRSKQPFVVTFFRASPSPVRAPRAARPLRKRLPKKTNELPQLNKLPGVFGEARGWPGARPTGSGRDQRWGQDPLPLSRLQTNGHLQPPSLTPSFAPCRWGPATLSLRPPCHPKVPSLPSPGSPGLPRSLYQNQCLFLQAAPPLVAPGSSPGSLWVWDA